MLVLDPGLASIGAIVAAAAELRCDDGDCGRTIAAKEDNGPGKVSKYTMNCKHQDIIS